MSVVTHKSKTNKDALERLRVKAILFDEIVEFIEDKSLGYLMKAAEKDTSFSLDKAKKLLR